MLQMICSMIDALLKKIGIDKFPKRRKDAAAPLKLPEHLLVDAAGDIIAFKHIGEWKSSTMVEHYIRPIRKKILLRNVMVHTTK